MKKIFTFLLAFYLLTSLSAQQSDLSAEAWQADIQYLTEQVIKIHPNVFHQVNAADFNAQAEALRKEVGNKDGNEIAAELMKLLTRIGDGNTRIDLKSLNWQKYPIRVQYFEDQLRVVATDSIYQRWLGLKVLKMGQYTLPELQEKLLPLVPVNESSTHAKYLIQQYLCYPDLLIPLGIAGKRYAVIMFEDEDDGRTKAPLLAKEEPKHWYKVQEDTPAHLVPPYDAIHPDLWLTHLADDQVNFLYAKDYPSDKAAWKKLVKQLKKKFKQNPSSKVLIDLRENESGNFSAGKQLIKLVSKSSGIKRGGQIYVAIGRQTYAAATLDALQWREKYGAILVGETTGANPNGYRENTPVTLPNSGIQVFVPTKEYQTLDNHVGGLKPDQNILMDWEGYKKGIDVVLEWVLKQ